MRYLYAIFDAWLCRLLKPIADKLSYPHYPDTQFAGSEHPCPRCGLPQKTHKVEVPAALLRPEPSRN